jgi:hypothetical protein
MWADVEVMQDLHSSALGKLRCGGVLLAALPSSERAWIDPKQGAETQKAAPWADAAFAIEWPGWISAQVY